VHKIQNFTAHCISIGGVCDPALERFLKEHTDVVEITLGLDKLHEQLMFKAQQENSDFSKYCRRLLEKGVSVEAYKEDIDFITKIIRNELENVIEPYPNKLYTFKELLENSMKLGVEYMKVKDFEVDQFLENGEKMIEQSDKL